MPSTRRKSSQGKKVNKKLEAYYFQRRVLFGCTVGLIVACVLWIIAISTDKWFLVKGGKGIFVESHRRFFKSSHTGIWRSCRFSLTPKPINDDIIRNFTIVGVTRKDSVNQAKLKLRQNYPLVDEIYNENLNADDVDEIDEKFKRALFGLWLKGIEKKEFRDIKKKLHEKLPKNHYKDKVILDNERKNIQNISQTLGDLLFTVKFNDTSTLNVAIPTHVRNILIKDWETLGYDLTKILYIFAKNLQLDENLYKDNIKYVFYPPVPTYDKSKGFIYEDWKKCTLLSLFASPDEEVIKQDPSIDEELLDLSRTSATFAVITIFLMVLGLVFTVYTFLNPRYMFKRLAGGIHGMTGLTSAIVCHVVLISVDYRKNNLFYAFPKDATYNLGYGFYFACLASAMNFFSFIMFMWYSKKKKGSKAATEELGMADEAIQIGR